MVTRTLWRAGLAALACCGVAPAARSVGAELPVTQVDVDATGAVGSIGTQLATQVFRPDDLATPEQRARLRALQPPFLRIHAGTGASDPPLLPAGVDAQDWNFAPLDGLIGEARAAGSQPLLNVHYAPDWMWTCQTRHDVGELRDPTYREFGDYMARLVSYYDTGRMTTADGQTITNPAGTANRITYWEIWNEPDDSSEAPCRSSGDGPTFDGGQYAAMWNVVAARMRAVDPTIKLVGPALADLVPYPHGPNCASTYLPSFLGAATPPPDVLSAHAYGGSDPLGEQPDAAYFDDGDCYGLAGILSSLSHAQTLAGDKPIWMTEYGLNTQPGAQDPRVAGAFATVWNASLFRGMAEAGAKLLFQYTFSYGPEFGMVSPTGQPYLAYWRDFYLARYFPPGSQELYATSTNSGVEVLAAQAPDSPAIRVLLINRQTASVGGVNAGLPATVAVSLKGVAGVSEATLRVLDDSIVAGGPRGDLATGPLLDSLPAALTASVAVPRYGVALLEFKPSGVAPQRQQHPVRRPGRAARGERSNAAPGNQVQHPARRPGRAPAR